MSQLTDDLKREHTHLLNGIKRAKELGLNTKEGADAFLGLKEAVITYLKRGDEKLYPSLRNAAKQNSQLQFVLDLNARAPEVVTQTAREFFQKYTSGRSDLEFVMDFGKLAAILGQRIRNEANALLIEYDKLKL